MIKHNKSASVGMFCVACGTCLKACPFGAITIHKGIVALVNSEKCVGCGKCSRACPASSITIVEREVQYEG